MPVLRDPAALRRLSEELRTAGRRIGLVPTMGCLHEGHLSLIRAAAERTDYVITTLFVNPAQFGPSEDYTRYPRDEARDAALALQAGTRYLFAPPVEAVYPGGFRTAVEVEGLDAVLEGRSRPGHFRGVATVVAKLFNMARPHLAVFGQKDAQQALLIRRMAADLDFGIEILIMPTVREPDGLAMSSRNVYLTPQERREAPVLYRALTSGMEKITRGERDCGRIIGEIREMIRGSSTSEVDYISVADAATLDEKALLVQGEKVLISLAVRFPSARLIDNVVVRVP
ncbi:MAG: pantoate--beta-alanine ligase [Bacteroidota bacterium]